MSDLARPLSLQAVAEAAGASPFRVHRVHRVLKAAMGEALAGSSSGFDSGRRCD